MKLVSKLTLLGAQIFGALIAALLIATCQKTCVQAAGESPTSAEHATAIAAIPPPLPSDSELNAAMTPSAVELADMTEVSALLDRLRREQQRARQMGAADTTPEHLLTVQRLLYVRSKIDVYIQTASLEIGSVIGKLNSGLADLADRKALIADTRARTARRTSFINLISGGLTKIGGYSIALTPATLIPTNVLEVFDGGVQTSLSVFTLKQLKDEQRLGKARPEILKVFLSGNNLTTHMFPATVWTFLNRVPPLSKDNKTRRQVLIDSWVKIGRLSDGRNQNLARRQNNSLSPAQESRLDALDDTVAMTSDLKSVIESMETSLMELGQAYRDSYKDDPEI